MRKFILGDLHGNGEVYDSVMAYLDNLAFNEKIELYMNGDLIDWGLDSYRMLLDIYRRIEEKGNIQIYYLGGNHEWLLYQACKNKKPHKMIDSWDPWMQNGGWVIEGEMDALEDNDKYDDMCRELMDFTGSLKIVHVFEETILNKPILLVHGQAPLDVSFVQSKDISCDHEKVFNAVWKREDEYDPVFGSFPIGTNRIGHKDYFTICGNNPVSEEEGFAYRERGEESYLDIDGGCHLYAVGQFEYDHVPLVEIKDHYLSILVFNHNNEITAGYYFDGVTMPMKEEEVEKNRAFLNPLLNGNGKKNKKMILEFKQDGIL